jgi:hypothetical protein
MASDIIGYDDGAMSGDIIGDGVMGEMFTGDHDLDQLLAMGAAVTRQRRAAGTPAPGRKFEVKDTARGVWREQYVPLNLAGGPLATVLAGATVIVATVLQKKFRANRLIIDSGVAGGYVVNDIRVGVAPQLGALGSLPGRMFTEFAVGIGLHGDTGDPGISMSVSITNITGGPLPFVAGFQGIVVE